MRNHSKFLDCAYAISNCLLNPSPGEPCRCRQFVNKAPSWFMGFDGIVKIINEQCIVYHFKCGLCKMDYVGFTNRHLFQCINEHTNSRSSIGKHMKLQHEVQRPAIAENFTILKKCWSKLDCLVYEMLLIKELNHHSMYSQTRSARSYSLMLN